MSATPDRSHDARWFDAHLDLAMMAALGRDMHAPAATQTRPEPPCSVTLPAMREGRVTHALATIFIEPDGHDAPIAYRSGDAESARRAALAQGTIYREWFARGQATPMRAFDGARAAQGDAHGPVLGVLIEGADALRDPEDLAWWCRHLPVVAVGMTWVHAGRYAGGNATQEGLTSLGRALVPTIERAGLAHDVSHLSDRALSELLEIAGPGATLIASHSNCRSIVGDPANQRHLTDAQLRALTARGAVIGLNLYSKFMMPGYEVGQRASIEQTLAHVERVSQLAGSRRHVGLGSDADGGFSAARLPSGIDRLSDLDLLAQGLRASPFNWTDEEIAGFCWGNWARVFGVDPSFAQRG
jgi:membrane dipeptidase